MGRRAGLPFEVARDAGVVLAGGDGPLAVAERRGGPVARRAAWSGLAWLLLAVAAAGFAFSAGRRWAWQMRQADVARESPAKPADLEQLRRQSPISYEQLRVDRGGEVPAAGRPGGSSGR